MSENIVHISHSAGHRDAYLNLFVSLTGFTPLVSQISGQTFFKVLRAKRLLFATVGFAYRRYWMVSLLRSILGRPTVTIFIGATHYHTGSRVAVSFIDKLLLKAWRYFPRQTSLAIIPYNVEPALSQVTKDYIYDPQLWDLWVEDPPLTFPATALSDSIKKERKGRKVLIFIGKGSRLKSFAELANFAEVNKEKLYVVAAGKVMPECAAAAEKLRALDMVVENRFISDEELLSLYGVADYAWCFYAPDYDQSSGVFGRAIQLGVKPIIRAGSVIAKIVDELEIGGVKLETEDLGKNVDAADMIVKFEEKSMALAQRRGLFTKLRDESIEKLKIALQ